METFNKNNMVTTYPAQIDNSTSLPLVNSNTVFSPTIINNLQGAIVAIETALGVNPASIYGTVRARLDTIEGVITGNFNGQNIVTTGSVTGNAGIFGSVNASIITTDGKFLVNGITTSNISDGYQAVIYYDKNANALKISQNGGSYTNVMPWINVQNYGALGDGSHDDTSAVIAAIASASAFGGTVYFPSTKNYYRITSAITLPSNTNLRGEFSQNLGVTNIGTVLIFQRSGSGFIMNGSGITIRDMMIFCDPTAGPHFSQPTPGSVCSYWLFENVRAVSQNPNKGILVLGSGTADGYGVENNWSTFSRFDLQAAASQAVPLIQLYGQGGGLSNLSFRDCVFTGGGLVGSGTESLAEFVHVESTDSGLLCNMEFKNISFEIPYHGAIVFKSVSDSKITNCWGGDLTGHAPAKPLISIDKSTHTGALASRNILIDTLFSDIGNNVAGQETIDVVFGNSPVIVHNSKILSVNTHGYGAAIVNEGSSITYVIGGTDLIPGTSDGGFVRAQVSQIVESNIVLHNDLNSDASPGFYTGFAYVITSAIRPILLGGLTLGVYGAGTEFTLYHNHTQPLVLVNEDGYSTAAYRITTPNGQNINAGTNCIVKFLYDGNTNRWLVTSIMNPAANTAMAVNVKNFGAVGDGSTDDTTAIQNALNFLSTTGGTLFMPQGTYVVSSTLSMHSSVSFTGDGRPKWLGAGLTGSGSWFKWAGTSTDNIIECIGIKNWEIKGIGIMGGRGGIASSLNAIYVSGTQANPSFQQRIIDCIIDEVDMGVLWGAGDGYQSDSSSIENCEFYNTTTAGIRINSVNAADASKIERCGFSPANGFGIDIIGAGFLRIVDCDAGGAASGLSGFIKINASTNPVTIENCEAELIPYFLYCVSGVGDSSVITLKNCYSNCAIYLATLVRVVSTATLITGTLTLDHSGAKWLGFGDRVIVSLGGKVIINSGFLSNQELLNSSVGTGFQPKGQINWSPYYWWGAAQGDGTSDGYVGAEWNKRSGIRGVFWNTGQVVGAGQYYVPTVDNGHAYIATNSGTTGGVEPIWPTGSGSTVNDNGIIWQESGTAALFVPFAPLNQSAGIGIPTEGYFQAGHIRWNISPVAGGTIGWVCTVSGNPGTWKTFGTIAA